MDGVSRTRCYHCGELCYNGLELSGREFFEVVKAKRPEKGREKKARAKRAKDKAAKCIKYWRWEKKAGSSEMGREGIS